MNRTEKKILKKIKTGEVKMKPKWQFWTWELSKSGAYIAGVFLAVTAGLVLKMFFETYDLAELKQYGEVGRELLIEDFPYLWLLTGIAGIILAVILLKNIGENYKKPMFNRVIITAAIILVLAITGYLLKLLL